MDRKPVHASQLVPAWFSKITAAAPDEILGVNAKFRASSNPKKTLLGIGAYRDDEGKPVVLNVVQKVKKQILDDSPGNHEYLPIDGDTLFVGEAMKLLFGDDSDILSEQKYAAAHTLSGTGSLRVAMEFVKQWAEPFDNKVYVSSPTWGNHQQIIKASGLDFDYYTYYSKETKSLDIAGFLADINSATPKSCFLLHSCAHNPTGVDPSQSQWDKILAAMLARNHLVIFDTAYQGFATGDFDADAYPIRKFAQMGAQFLVTQSFAKNLGLYGERVGTTTIVCASAQSASNVLTRLKRIIRPMWSNPPRFGALVAYKVMSDPKLKQEWFQEVRTMSLRISAMRKALYDHLIQMKTPGSWVHVIDQIGMFCFTGLTQDQVDALIEKFAIFLIRNGRISIAGLNSSNVKYVAESIDWVVRNVNSSST